MATDVLVSTVVEGLVAAWNGAPFPEAALVTANAVDENDDGLPEHLTLTADKPGVPFRVETATADAGGFQIDVLTLIEGDPGQNEIQRVSLPPATSGGTFTLTFQGQTTAGIAFDADAATLQAALESLNNLAAGDVLVTGASPVWFVEFGQAYAAVNVPLLTGDGTLLSGAATITHATLTEGQAGQNEIVRFGTAGHNTMSFVFGGSPSYELHVNAAENEVRAALETLPSIGAGNVLVTQTGAIGDYVITVEFLGDLGQQDVGPLTLLFDNATEEAEVIQEGSAADRNETQTVTIHGAPTGGTFTLTFEGQTTAALTFDASASEVKTALDALSNVDAVQVVRSGSTYAVTFLGSLAATDVGQMTSDASALTGGAVTAVTTQAAIAAVNEQQRIAFSQPPGGGTFTLTLDAGFGGETTAAIAHDASAATLQALATPGPGDVSVSGPGGGPWVVTFTGALAARDVAEITGDGSGLTGGGSQSLVQETLVRSRGPNHFDDPGNWTGESVPHSLDALFFNGGKADCLYGLQQRVAFTVEAATDQITLAEPADFVEGQAVRLFTTGTLPAGLSTGTSYYVQNLDYDAGTCQLALTPGGAAIDVTDGGSGTHVMALHLAAIKFHSRWKGNLGLSERNEGDYYEYLPRSLAVVVDTITIGEGEGDGQARLDLDVGDEPTTLIVYQSGGSNEAGLPAIRWKGTNPANAVVIHDGEFGAAVYATEVATIDSLVQHAGLVQMGIVTLGSLTKHGGELIAENATLSGPLRLHA